MKEPTMEEVLKLVTFGRDEEGCLFVENVKGTVAGEVWGDVLGDVKWSVWGTVHGDVKGSVWGMVRGTINYRDWQFVSTPIAKAVRLIRQERYREAIKVLEEIEQ